MSCGPWRRTIYRAGGQLTARSAPAVIRQSRRTEFHRSKLKLAPQAGGMMSGPDALCRRNGERGSALLIVFLFAAFVAIMLYKEMPDVMFEAQRQKEQVLIDRGDEYKHAIKLFYRRNQSFPTSLDQLDKFNNIRYIRHRFKDPMTGKDEWRLIHISGPGFVLTDSKVTQPKTDLGNGASPFGSQSTASAFGSQSSSASPDSGTPTSPTETQPGSEQPAGPDPADLARRRPPEAPANTFGVAPQPSNEENAYEDRTQDLSGVGANAPQPGSQMGGGVPAPNGMSTNGMNPANANVISENGTAALQPQSAQPRGMQPQGMQPQSMQPQSMQPQSAQSAGLSAINNALRQPGPTRTAGASSMGTMFAAGSIAGVASKGKGKSIKVVDKQTDYSKWEFVYNPQKELAQKMNAAMPSPGQSPTRNQPSNTANSITSSPSTSANSPSQ